jgi:hypothetical protein
MILLQNDDLHILTLKTLRNGNNVSQKHNLEHKTLDNCIISFAPKSHLTLKLA